MPRLITHLTGILPNRLRAMLETGELEAVAVEKSWCIRWSQLAALAIDQWGIEVIEQELGEEARDVLPPLVRTVPVSMRLPRYLVAMLQALEKRDGLTAARRIADALACIAEEHAGSLEDEIPGFAEAMNFPEGG